jgi:hypothetical protein
MKKGGTVENWRRKDVGNGDEDEIVDGIRVQGRKTWHLCFDFLFDFQTPRLTSALDLVSQASLTFDVVKAGDHPHHQFAVVVVVASDNLWERPEDSSWGSWRFAGRDSGLIGYRDWHCLDVVMRLEEEG